MVLFQKLKKKTNYGKEHLKILSLFQDVEPASSLLPAVPPSYVGVEEK